MGIHVKPEAVCQEQAFRDARMSVANSKLVEFRKQCWRLALLSQQGAVIRSDAVDLLYEIATAHALVRALGADHVEAIIAEPFAAVESAQT